MCILICICNQIYEQYTIYVSPNPIAKGPSDKPHKNRFKAGTRAGVWVRTARKKR